MTTMNSQPDGLVVDVRDAEWKVPGHSFGPVSLAVEPGFILGVIGPNGAGKTSLFRLLTGAATCAAGSCTVLGQSISREAGGAAGVGFVSGDDTLPGSLTGNQLALTTSALDPTFSRDAFRQLTDRYGVNLRKKLESLNRSARTHLLLALALARTTSLLILDEPTAGLDPADRDDMLATCQEYIESGERSVILSSHLTDDIHAVCDHVAVVQRGKIAVQGETLSVIDSYRLLAAESFDALPSSAPVWHLDKAGASATAVAQATWCEDNAHLLAQHGIDVSTPHLDHVVALAATHEGGFA